MKQQRTRYHNVAVPYRVMRYCLNPDCLKPQNSDRREVCRSCGAKLRLKDRYLPIQLIGQGGFGRTFLAIDEDRPSKPRCVIKQFLPLVQNPRSLKKAAALFEQEAIQLEQLGHHSQIPTLLAHFSLEGRQYLVQEYIDGKTLAEILQVHGSFNPAQIRAVLASLLPVLAFIHSHQVIHRDIKPANIISMTGQITEGRSNALDWADLLQLLTTESQQGYRDHQSTQGGFSDLLSQRFGHPAPEWAVADAQRCQQLASQFSRYATLGLLQRQYLLADASRLVYELRLKYEQPLAYLPSGNLVLVDFGAAKQLTETALLRTGTTIGSPEFLAPEQAHGKAVFASDLYSLGVTCIHLLTNTPPPDLFDLQRGLWIWRQHLKQPIKEGFGKLLDRLLESSLNRRYASAAEVLADLEMLPGEPLTAVIPAGSVEATSFTIQPGPKSDQSVAGSSTSPASSAPLTNLASRREKAALPWHCIQTLAGTGKITAIALSESTATIASASGTTIRLWNLLTGQLLRTLTGHLDIVQSLTVTPNGQTLVSGSADKSILLWNLNSGQKRSSLLLHSDTVLSVAVSPDSLTLVSGSLYDPIKQWSLSTNQELSPLVGHSGWVDVLTFNPAGSLLASGGTDHTILLWAVKTQQAERMLKGHSQAVTTLAFSPDGKTLASGSWDGTIKLWSLATYREKRTIAPQIGRINALAYTADGKSLAIGGDSLQIWNPRTGQCITTLTGHTAPISALVFGRLTVTGEKRPQSILLSGSWDGTVRVWTA
ncbi:MAG TPA: serine/threonine-protein kinase [Coleofasciculaceae cyanobacterium]